MFYEKASHFGWWGKRTYVHGTQIIAEVIERISEYGLEPNGQLSFAFKEPLRTQADILISDEELCINEPCAAVCKGVVGDKNLFVAVRPNGIPLSERLLDDEAELISKARFCEGGAEIFDYDLARWPSVLVALGKKFLTMDYETQGADPWILASLDFSWNDKPINLLPILIRDTRVIANTMSRSAVFYNGKKIGTIGYKRMVLNDRD